MLHSSCKEYLYKAIWSTTRTLFQSLSFSLLSTLGVHCIMQGIGDSSQGFANAILFVIFTKNIRDSFIKCLCCGKTFKNDDNLEAEGHIQNTRSNQSSRLSLISGDSKRGSPVVVVSENSQDDEEEEREKVSLVFGGSGSSLKTEQSNHYGAVS